MSEIVHVARNGNPFGQYRRNEISELLDQGTLRGSDLYYNEGAREWVPLTGWKNADDTVAPPEIGEASTPTESPDGTRSGRRRRSSGRSRDSKRPRKRNPSESALPGWIAALFAIGVAAGLWAWGQNLGAQLATAQKRITELEEVAATYRQQNAILLEMSPPGKVRGVITSEPVDGRLSVMSGVSVNLFPIDAVRSALVKIANEPTPITEEEFSQVITKMQAALPAPLNMSLSDSNGRFEIAVPEGGDFGLLATAFKQGGGSTQRLLWLVELEASDEPSPVLSLGESNAITVTKPAIRLSPTRR